MLHGPAMKLTSPKTIRALASVFVTIGLLWILGRSVDVGRVVDLFQGGDWRWWAAAVALVPVQIGLCALRWHRVSADLSLPMSRRQAVEEYGLSTLLNQLLPGGMAGDATRVWRHKQGHGALGAPLRAALVDRVIGHWAHLAVTLFGLLLWAKVHPNPPPEGGVGLVVAMTLVFVVLWFRPMPGLRTLISDLRLALARGTQWMFHAGVSLALVMCFVTSFWFCAEAIGRPLGPAAVTAVPLMMLVMVVPLSVGGWGLREVSSAVVLAQLGWDASDAVALSAAFGFANLFGAIPGGWLLLRPSSKVKTI